MQAIIKACKNGCLKELVEPTLVIASKPGAGGIKKAIDAGMKKEDVIVICPTDFKQKAEPREAFGEAIIRECERRKVNFVGQYGWLAKTPANVIQRFEGAIVNQHPGPLDPGYPDFGGKGMYGRAVHAARMLFVRLVAREGNFWTEATTHRVTEEYDKGALIQTARVSIECGDDVISLQEKVLPVEHLVQIETLGKFALGTAEDYQRLERLVLPGEEEKLRQAKEAAMMLFPRG